MKRYDLVQIIELIERTQEFGEDSYIDVVNQTFPDDTHNDLMEGA